MAILEVDELQIEFMTAGGVIRAVDGVSFHVDRGETVTIIGESGSGKSTTAMGLLRLLPEDLAKLSGTVLIDGKDVITDNRAARKMRGNGVALIPQDPMTALSPVTTIGKQLMQAILIRQPKLGKAAARDEAIKLMNDVHIRTPEEQLEKFPHQLSGGMLQRVLIAMAFAAKPNLLVADEPTSALDVTVQASILDLLLELQEQTGIAILMITHDIGVARLVSDRIHVMKSGVFVESGGVEQVVNNPQAPYTQKLLAAVPQLGPWDESEASAGAGAGAGAQAPAQARVEARANETATEKAL